MSCLFGRNRSFIHPLPNNTSAPTHNPLYPPPLNPPTAPLCCLFEDAASISKELIHLSSFMSRLGEYLQQWSGSSGNCKSGSPIVTRIHSCHTPCYGLTTSLFLVSKTTIELEWDEYLGHRVFLPEAMGCCRACMPPDEAEALFRELERAALTLLAQTATIDNY